MDGIGKEDITKRMNDWLNYLNKYSKNGHYEIGPKGILMYRKLKNENINLGERMNVDKRVENYEIIIGPQGIVYKKPKKINEEFKKYFKETNNENYKIMSEGE